jgi:gliding motility-associated-like protein
MKLKIKNYILIMFLLGLTYSANSQLVTSTTQTPTQLVEDVLVGGGVVVSNVTYTGDTEAIGSFNGANTNLGLTSGIVLTTGTVLNTAGGGIFGGQEGPHGPNDTGSGGTDNSAAGYQPLTDIAAEDTHNAAVLEFDFVPQSDTIRFKYVFGSEEYPEFVDAGFNDVFAFFISGPGFGGTFNMATIPGTGGTPVTIDNVNDNVNSSYYINNGDGGDAPQNGSDSYIQYDGFTVVIEAVAKVECGEIYHLKLAIADVGDGAYDSGIFLEANSLASYAPLEVVASTTLDLPNNMIAEGCETGFITLTRNLATAGDALTIPIIISGTATEGVDYDNIPASVTFTPGQTTLTFSFNIIEDGLVEGNESIIIEFNHPDPCGNDNFISVNLTIFDVDPLVITIPDQTVNCAGDEATLVASITGGVSIYDYNWDTGELTETITISPNQTTNYTLTVTDLCIADSEQAIGTVVVPIYPPLNLITTNDTSVLCPNTPFLLASEPSGGEGTYSYAWTNIGTAMGNSAVQNVSPLESTSYTVTITDGCGETINGNIEFTVITPLLTLTMSPNQLVCPGDSAVIWTEAEGGLGDFTYYWNHSAQTEASVIVKPQNSTLYTVSVEDGCHTYSVQGQTKVNIVRPHASFNVLTNEPMEGLPVSFQNTSDGSVAWEWYFSNHDFSNIHSPNTIYANWGWYDIELVAINEIGCKDTLNRTIYIKPEFYFYAPNAFTPDGDTFNNAYSVSAIGAKKFDFMIFNRWGDLIYQTSDIYFEWDGSYKGKMVPDEALIYRTKVTDLEGFVHEYFGTITILK